MILGAILARNWRVVGLGITTISVLIAVGVGSSTARAVLFPGKSDAQITGMTGRTYLWEDYLTQFEEKPLEGQGYAVPSRISSLKYTTNTHNAYLSVLAGTGLIGAAFVIVMCMMFWSEIVGPLRCVKPGAIGCMSAMCAGAINCLGSSIVFETWNSTGVVFVSIMAIHTFYVRNGRHVRTR